MSCYLESYAKTMKNEGGYCNDPLDAGGETYKGISRKYNPSWGGWFVIDALRDDTDFPECLEDDELLQIDVKKLYKQKYFDPYEGDSMSLGLAMEMFDTSVNMGVGRAVKFLQISLNILNRNGKLYSDMVEDGDFGPTTEKCLKLYLENDSIELLLKMLNVLQGNHYINYMKKSPNQERYARGWFERVEISKV